MRTQEEIDADNLIIANRLSENFGKSILQTVKSDYARYDLDCITQDFKHAQANGLVFDISSGPELLGFMTPDDVIERFSKELNFRNHYNLVTPEYAENKISSKLEESAAHFETFPPEIQAERNAVFKQNEEGLKSMRQNITEYAQEHTL